MNDDKTDDTPAETEPEKQRVFKDALSNVCV